MTGIPSLPTDNLYKFCAVTGAVFFVLAALTTFQSWRDVKIKQRAFDVVSQRVTVGVLKKQIAQLQDMLPTRSPQDRDKFRRAKEEAIKDEEPLAAAQKELQRNESALSSARYDFSIVGTACLMVAIFGLSLGGYGFWNWRKIQLKQDQLLEMELLKHT